MVVTGAATGVATDAGKIARFRKALGGFPLVVGAGMTAESCREQLAIADGAIAVTWVKEEGDTHRPVDPQRARTLMRAVREVRDAGPASRPEAGDGRTQGSTLPRHHAHARCRAAVDAPETA